MLRVAWLTAILFVAPAFAEDLVVAETALRDPKPVFATIESRNVVPARARIGGTVAELSVREGDLVTAGQEIASVGDDKLASQLVALKAEADKAAADLVRARDLAARGVIAKAQLDAAAAAASVAQSRLEAQRQLLAEGQVFAPRAGRVLRVPTTTGAVVMPGEAIAVIADETYVLRVRLPERHARFLKAGDDIQIDNGDGARKSGKITLVYPQIEDGRVVADAAVEGLEQYFVGERVRVLVASEPRPAIVVPSVYVLTRFGADYVRLKASDGSVVDAPVQIGQPLMLETGAAAIEILSGLRPGDTLVQP